MLNFDTFIVNRLIESEESGVNSLSMESTHVYVTGYLEQATPEFAAMVEGDYGMIHRLFSDDTDADIRIGDRIIHSNNPSEVYDVKGVNYTNKGPSRRLEVVLYKPMK